MSRGLGKGIAEDVAPTCGAKMYRLPAARPIGKGCVAALHLHLCAFADICDAALTRPKRHHSTVIRTRVSRMAAAAAMMNLNSRERDEFLKALDEARRAAMADDRAPEAPRKPRAAAYGSADFLH